MSMQDDTNISAEDGFSQMPPDIIYVPSPTNKMFFEGQRVRTLIKNICRSEGFRARYIVHFMVELPFFFPLPTRELMSMSNEPGSICMFSLLLMLDPL